MLVEERRKGWNLLRETNEGTYVRNGEGGRRTCLVTPDLSCGYHIIGMEKEQGKVRR